MKEQENMPLIQVKLIEDVFTAEQKKELIGKLTDAVAQVKGENMRPVTWVLIEDVRSGEWGIGGQAMTSESVRALAAAPTAVGG
jgi:4-oxalocrotonate tautomerase